LGQTNYGTIKWKGNEQIVKGNEQIFKGNEQIVKGNEPLVDVNEAILKGNGEGIVEKTGFLLIWAKYPQG